MPPLVLELLRHGESLPAGPGGDASRALTARGIERLERLGRALAGEGWTPGRAFASPLARARQSAERVLAALPAAPPVEVLEALRPDGAPEEVLEALALHGADRGRVLLVGHQPLLGRIASHLTGIETPFAPGAFVRLDCGEAPTPGRARILHARPPEPA